MIEWQPIETAPKDGRFVLLYSAQRNGGGIIETGCFIAGFLGGWGHAHNWMGWGATHWMPLPEPPTMISGPHL